MFAKIETITVSQERKKNTNSQLFGNGLLQTGPCTSDRIPVNQRSVQALV